MSAEPATLKPLYTEADRETAFDAWRTVAARSDARVAKLADVDRKTIRTRHDRYDWVTRANALDAEEAAPAKLGVAALIHRRLLDVVMTNLACMDDPAAAWKDRLTAAHWLAGCVGVSPTAKQLTVTQ